MDLDKDPRFATKDSLYLKADDFPGKSFELQISQIDTDTFSRPGEDDEEKLVLKFQGKDKGIVLNWTNLKALKAAYGPNTDEWVGEKVFVTTKFYDSFGKHGFVISPGAIEGDEIPF